MIVNLDREFGIPGSISVASGVNGLPKVVMTHSSGSHAEVYLHGAHLTSWKDADGEELLFVSQNSHFENNKPIRGGVPIAFPQFGSQGPLPQHGFARISEWKIGGTEVGESGEVSLALDLSDTTESFSVWQHKFLLRLTFTLKSDSIAVHSHLANTGSDAFSFTFAFHTYFGLPDIRKIKLQGLKSISYIDSVCGDARDIEDREIIEINEEIDRIYENAPDSVTLLDESRRITLRIDKHGLPDVTVWNPWIGRSRQIPDLGDDEYNHFLCVETGQMAAPTELHAGNEWECDTVFTCL